MAIVCKRCRVDGRVQGVFFRASTLDKARQLGLHGWVRNLYDGRVECLIQGEEDRVKQLQDWLWQGSPPSNVTHVQCYDEAVIDCDSFRVVHEGSPDFKS